MYSFAAIAIASYVYFGTDPDSSPKHKVSATIDDSAILDEISAALKTLGYAVKA